jgi:hypothetical protein
MQNYINNYQSGKIYKIQPIETSSNGDIYIGSTIGTLEDRMSKHLSDYRLKKFSNLLLGEQKKYDTTCGYIFEKYDPKNCEILMLELFPCDSRKKLEERESFYINSTTCVNKNKKKSRFKPNTNEVSNNLSDKIKSSTFHQNNDNERFYCIYCKSHSTTNGNFQKHLLTEKHIMKTPQKYDIIKLSYDPKCKFQCKNCNKKYKGLSGLWHHKQVCLFESKQTESKSELNIESINDINILQKDFNLLEKKYNELQENNDELKQIIILLNKLLIKK